MLTIGRGDRERSLELCGLSQREQIAGMIKRVVTSITASAGP